MAYKMGLPVKAFIASCNENHPVADYLRSGDYHPVPSVETISNAMDVGSPSNFIRMRLLAGDEWLKVREIIKGYYTDDQKTQEIMSDVYTRTRYVMCPHTAVGYDGLQQYATEYPGETTGIVLSTAHYAKFLPSVEGTLGVSVPVPARLAELLDKTKKSIPMGTDFAEFKAYLLQ
jgi:threonine synthase